MGTAISDESALEFPSVRRLASSFSSPRPIFVASRLPFTHHKDYRRRPQARIADSSSTKAVSLSSVRTMNRFQIAPMRVTIQILRPCTSKADTQPQLHPALLRLSAMISQYRFTHSIVL